MAEKKKTTTKRKVGRPKKGIDLLPENWKEQILSLYSEGGADIEVKAMIWKWLDSFSDDLFYRWIEEEPEFSGTIKKGRKLAEAWWYSKGREVENKNLNSNLFHINMKNRFNWSDKQQIDHTSKGKRINISPIEFTKGSNKD